VHVVSLAVCGERRPPALRRATDKGQRTYSIRRFGGLRIELWFVMFIIQILRLDLECLAILAAIGRLVKTGSRPHGRRLHTLLDRVYGTSNPAEMKVKSDIPRQLFTRNLRNPAVRGQATAEGPVVCAFVNVLRKSRTVGANRAASVTDPPTIGDPVYLVAPAIQYNSQTGTAPFGNVDLRRYQALFKGTNSDHRSDEHGADIKTINLLSALT